MSWKRKLKKIWHFIWEDNSIWSWLVNIALAFILIKFIVYPGLGFIFQTTHPVVAVVSESMEHDENFNDWWVFANKWYVANNISEDKFRHFPLRNGFDKGDIMVLVGVSAKNVEVGDVIVFWSTRRDPIIHRVVNVFNDGKGYIIQTKGDNYATNPTPIRTPYLDETRISEEQLIGKAVVRIPFLGYIKIWFVDLINLFVLRLIGQ